MKRIPLRGKTPPAEATPAPAFAARSPEQYRKSQQVPPGAVFLLEVPMHGWPPGWTMKIYDIGEEEKLHVVYPDCAQIHPLLWHKERLRDAGINFSHLERKVVVPVQVKQPPPKKMTKEEHQQRAAADYTAIVGVPPPVQRVKLRPR